MVTEILSEKIKSWIIYGKSAFFYVTLKHDMNEGLYGLFNEDPIETIVIKKEQINGQWVEIN
jgi:hypothetical protein